MRKWFVMILLLVLGFPSSVQAQKEITFESLKVMLWPDYDQPSMLVIYDFEVAAGTTLPVMVDIRVPRDGNITAVAYMDNGLLNAEFNGPREDGNWQVVTFIVRTPAVYRLEYYQPYNRDANVRSFTYQWSGDYAVNSFRVEVQLPGDSASIKTTPVIPFLPEQSFQVGKGNVGALPAGAPYQLDLQYSRTSNEVVFPSVSSQVTAEPITQNTAGRVTLDNLPYILLGFGILLIAGAVYYFKQSGAAPSKPRQRASKSRAGAAQTYCHECGARASADDRFCRVCGTKLRGG